MAAGWFLVPLRLFLGATFVFAGLQKLANPQFFTNGSPISIHSQLVAASHVSPIHALVVHLVPVADGVGAVIALGEIAIGLGILVGLLMRVAAAAGMLVSFSLFLDRELSHLALLHRLGHRLLLRLDTFRAGRRGRRSPARHLAGRTSDHRPPFGSRGLPSGRPLPRGMGRGGRRSRPGRRRAGCPVRPAGRRDLVAG